MSAAASSTVAAAATATGAGPFSVSASNVMQSRMHTIVGI